MFLCKCKSTYTTVYIYLHQIHKSLYTFLSAKYREYHQLFEKCQFVEAGKLLVTLLKSNTVPKRYHCDCMVSVVIFDLDSCFHLCAVGSGQHC